MVPFCVRVVELLVVSVNIAWVGVHWFYEVPDVCEGTDGWAAKHLFGAALSYPMRAF